MSSSASPRLRRSRTSRHQALASHGGRARIPEFRVPPSLAGPKRVFVSCHYCGYSPPAVPLNELCPKCGKHLQKIWARGKYFYGCTGYPDCDYSAPIQEIAFDKSEYAPDFDWEQACPECSKEMKVRHGRYGAFLGCTDYPDCKGTVNIPKKGEDIPPADQMPACPAIGCPGRISARRSRYGKIFFSCSTYPDCDVIVNKLEDLPVKYADHPRTPYEKKTRKKGAKTTKAKKCQEPTNGRLIVPDAKLAALFGSDEPIDMFKLAGLISKHLK